MTGRAQFDPPAFGQCKPDLRQPQVCTLIPDDGAWTGVSITVPRQVRLNRSSGPVPVCGFYQLPTIELMHGEPGILVHASVDGHMLPPAPYVYPRGPDAIAPPRPDLSPDEVAGVTEGRFFSFDLLAFVPAVQRCVRVDFRVGVLGRWSDVRSVILEP